MSTVQDVEVAIWVCPEGTSADVVEFPVGTTPPNVAGCGTHGHAFIKRCPSADCPDPAYHWSDLDRKFHQPCRTKIPWADSREETARALMEYDNYHSALVGYEAKPKPGAPPKSKQPLGQDEMPHTKTWLDRATGERAPRKTRFDTSEHPAEGLKWDELKKTTWDQLERGEVVRVDPPTRVWRSVVGFFTDPVGKGAQDVIRLLTIFVVASVVLWMTGVLNNVFSLNIPEPPDLRRFLGR